MRWITLLAIASASLSLLWSSPSRANDASIMRVARVQIDAKQYRKALSTLKLMSFCAVRCQYAKAIVHSKLRDRNETRLLTQQLVNDRATPAIIRSASAKLLNWAIDKRITETTGRRTVRRETLGGVTYSDDVCTNDTFLMKVWQQQWKEIGINPDDIFVPPAL